ncbi:hypothetical protein HK101_003009, partial [Irineochytrium annulatum]
MTAIQVKFRNGKALPLTAAGRVLNILEVSHQYFKKKIEPYDWDDLYIVDAHGKRVDFSEFIEDAATREQPFQILVEEGEAITVNVRRYLDSSYIDEERIIKNQYDLDALIRDGALLPVDGAGCPLAGTVREYEQLDPNWRYYELIGVNGTFDKINGFLDKESRAQEIEIAKAVESHISRLGHRPTIIGTRLKIYADLGKDRYYVCDFGYRKDRLERVIGDGSKLSDRDDISEFGDIDGIVFDEDSSTLY